MITGSTIAVGGIVIHQWVDDSFFINGQVVLGVGDGRGEPWCYVVVSLLDRQRAQIRS